MSYMFVHGLGQESSSWNETKSFIDRISIDYTPDLSSLLKNKPVNYFNLYKEFSHYSNEIPGKLNLCGLSLGAILALNYAIEFPNKVQSLVLVGGQYKMPKLLLHIQNIIFHIMPDRTFTSMGFTKRDFIQLTKSMVDLDFSQDLKTISCDTLVVCGEKDKPNKKAAAFLASNIPNAKLCYIPNAGHEVNIENPKEFAETLENFYKS